MRSAFLSVLFSGVFILVFGLPAFSQTGQFLYEENCSGCHGTGSQSNVTGESAGDIQEGISQDKGGMGSLSSLSASELQAIADYLATLESSDDDNNDNYSKHEGNDDDHSGMTGNDHEGNDDDHSGMTDNDHDGLDDNDEMNATYPNGATVQFFRYFDGQNHAVATFYDDEHASAIVFTPEGEILTHYYLEGNKLYDSLTGESWTLLLTQ